MGPRSQGADYTVMGAGPAENLLLLSRTVSLEPETGDTRSSMMRTRYGRNFHSSFDEHGPHELGWHLQQPGLPEPLICRSQRVLMMMLFEMEVGISAVPSLRWLWAGSTGALALRGACA